MPRTKVQERVPLDHRQLTEIMLACGNRCARCGKNLLESGDATVEHIIPIRKGGTNDPENLVVLCETCNTQKSDDIVKPSEFYAVLSEKRRKAMQKMIDQYCEDTDWLDSTHLFRLDQFEIKIPLAGSYSAVGRVRKLRRHEILPFMWDYVKVLGDIPAAPVKESQVTRPFYEIKIQGKTVMLVSPYINRNETDNGIRYFVVIVNVFVNPSIKDNGKLTTRLLRNTIGIVMNEIDATMRRKGSEIAMPATIICHNNDELAKRGLTALTEAYDSKGGPKAIAFPYAEDHKPRARETDDYTVCTYIIGNQEMANSLTTRLEKIYQKHDDGKLSEEDTDKKEAAAFKEFHDKIEDRLSGKIRPKAQSKPMHKPKKKGRRKK